MTAAADLIAPSPEGLLFVALIIGLSAWLQLLLCLFSFWEMIPVPRLAFFKPLSVAVIMAAFFCLTIFLQYNFGASSWQFIPLSSALAACVLLSCFSPTTALAFLVWNLLVRPWEIFPEVTILGLLPRGVAGLALAAWLGRVVLQRQLRLTIDAIGIAFAVLLLVLFLSAFSADNPEESLVFLMAQFIPIVVLLFLILNVVSNSRQLSLLINSILVASMAVTLAALLLTWIDPRLHSAGGGRLIGLGLLSNSNDLAALIVMILPFLLFKSFSKYHGIVGLLLGGVIVLIAISGLWLAQSRAVVLALILSVVAYLVLGSKNRRVLLVLFLTLGILPILWFSVSFRKHSDLHLSKVARLNYVETGYKMFKSSPLLGVGVGNYPRQYERYSGLFIERGERTAHSSWVLIAAEAGILGLICFGALFSLCCLKAWQLRRVSPEYLIALVGYGVTMSLLSHAYLFLPYLLFGLIAVRFKIYSSPHYS